jgi:hypothetical protein
MYLVIMNDDRRRRLVIGTSLQDGRLLVAQRPVYLRVVDLHRVQASKEGAARSERVLEMSDLEAK